MYYYVCMYVCDTLDAQPCPRPRPRPCSWMAARAACAAPACPPPRPKCRLAAAAARLALLWLAVSFMARRIACEPGPTGGRRPLLMLESNRCALGHGAWPVASTNL
jgi:hypothetical protein